MSFSSHNLVRLARILFALLGLLVLDASLSFGNVWPSPRIRWVNAVSVEVAACVLLLAVVLTKRKHIRCGALAGVWLILVVGHYIDVTATVLSWLDLFLFI